MNKIEKIKVAVDVALYYYTITTVLSLLSKILSDLLFRSSSYLIGELSSNALRYAVLAVVILFLAILSNVLKRKVQGVISIDSKPLLYLIVGVLLILNGVTSIPSLVSLIKVFLNHISSISKGFSNGQITSLINSIYYVVVPIVFYAFQIGIGVYFALMTIKRDKQIEETH